MNRSPALALVALLVCAPLAPAHAAVDASNPGLGSEKLVSTAAHDLDHTGARVPATAAVPPAGSIFVSPNGRSGAQGTQQDPLADVNEALAKAPSGGTIVFRAGTYRQSIRASSAVPYTIVSKSMTFQSFPGEQVWLDGSDPIPNAWTKHADGTWTLSWQTPTFCDGHYDDQSSNDGGSPQGPCAHADNALPDAPGEVPTDPQQLWIDGAKQRQVKGNENLDASSFRYDFANRRLVLNHDPAGHTVEAATRPVFAVLGGGGNYTLRGLGLRRFASNQYHNLTSGAVFIGGGLTTVEDCAFLDSSGGGLKLDRPLDGSSIRHNLFLRTGFTALSVNGGSAQGQQNAIAIKDNRILRANHQRAGAQCTESCEASGIKLAHLSGYSVTGNLVEQVDGRASGIWCDLNCSRGAIIGNTVRGIPRGSAIFDEVSSDTVILGNQVEQSLYGISIASARDFVWNNSLSQVTQALRVYDDPRTPSMPQWTNQVGPDTSGVSLANNVVAGLSGVNLVAFSETRSGTGGTAGELVIGELDHNLQWVANDGWYYVTVHGGWVDQRTSTSFSTAAKLCQAHGWECASSWSKGGQDPFVGSATHDLRLRPEAASLVAARPWPQRIVEALAQARLR